MVPDSVGWKKASFREILKLDRGSSPRPIVNYMTDSPDGVNWIKIGDTKNRDLYIDSTKERITPEGAKKSRKVSKGEIILSNSMSFGKPYILNIDGYIHDGWFVIRKYEEHLKREFLIQILSSELIQRQYQRLAAGGVVSNISSDLVYAVKIRLPPLPEQKKIAQILSTWDQAITATERLLANSHQRKKGLMQQLLTGKKRLPGFEGEWEDAHLKDIASISKGKALSSKDLEDGDFPVVAGGKTSPYTHKSYTHDHAITVSASGAYAGYVAYHEYKFWASDCSVVTAQKNSDTEFLFHVLTWNQKRIYSLQSGGAQPHVYPKDLYTLRVQVPTKPEQQAIADVITAAGREMDQLRLRLDLLQKEKKALMQQLLTGKRRVQVETEAA